MPRMTHGLIGEGTHLVFMILGCTSHCEDQEVVLVEPLVGEL